MVVDFLERERERDPQLSAMLKVSATQLMETAYKADIYPCHLKISHTSESLWDRPPDPLTQSSALASPQYAWYQIWPQAAEMTDKL